MMQNVLYHKINLSSMKADVLIGNVAFQPEK
jgi:hypothetical protein